jgi:hypothetical protein
MAAGGARPRFLLLSDPFARSAARRTRRFLLLSLVRCRAAGRRDFGGAARGMRRRAGRSPRMPDGRRDDAVAAARPQTVRQATYAAGGGRPPGLVTPGSGRRPQGSSPPASGTLRRDAKVTRHRSCTRHVDAHLPACVYLVARVQAGHSTREMTLFLLKGKAGNSSCFTIRLPPVGRTSGGITCSAHACAFSHLPSQ